MRAELLIVLAGLIADRDRKGPKHCEKWGVGKRRMIVGMALPVAEVVNAPVAAYAEAQREAAGALEAECRRCRLCRLGRE